MKGHERIIHLAAGTDVAGGFRHPERDYVNGIAATHAVCEAMRRNGIGELWFASSGVVYGRSASGPSSESDGPLLPESHYAAAKLAGEAIVIGGNPGRTRDFLYIDDLDRCEPDQVVQVLQAVHLLLAMDHSNYADMTDQAPTVDAQQHVRMFREFDPEAGEGDDEAPDPWYGGDAGFAEHRGRRESAREPRAPEARALPSRGSR